MGTPSSIDQRSYSNFLNGTSLVRSKHNITSSAQAFKEYIYTAFGKRGNAHPQPLSLSVIPDLLCSLRDTFSSFYVKDEDISKIRYLSHAFPTLDVTLEDFFLLLRDINAWIAKRYVTHTSIKDERVPKSAFSSISSPHKTHHPLSLGILTPNLSSEHNSIKGTDARSFLGGPVESTAKPYNSSTTLLMDSSSFEEDSFVTPKIDKKNAQLLLRNLPSKTSLHKELPAKLRDQKEALIERLLQKATLEKLSLLQRIDKLEEKYTENIKGQESMITCLKKSNELIMNELKASKSIQDSQLMLSKKENSSELPSFLDNIPNEHQLVMKGMNIADNEPMETEISNGYESDSSSLSENAGEEVICINTPIRLTHLDFGHFPEGKDENQPQNENELYSTPKTRPALLTQESATVFGDVPSFSLRDDFIQKDAEEIHDKASEMTNPFATTETREMAPENNGSTKIHPPFKDVVSKQAAFSVNQLEVQSPTANGVNRSSAETTEQKLASEILGYKMDTNNEDVLKKIASIDEPSDILSEKQEDVLINSRTSSYETLDADSLKAPEESEISVGSEYDEMKDTGSKPAEEDGFPHPQCAHEDLAGKSDIPKSDELDTSLEDAVNSGILNSVDYCSFFEKLSEWEDQNREKDEQILSSIKEKYFSPKYAEKLYSIDTIMTPVAPKNSIKLFSSPLFPKQMSNVYAHAETGLQFPAAARSESSTESLSVCAQLSASTSESPLLTDKLGISSSSKSVVECRDRKQPTSNYSMLFLIAFSWLLAMVLCTFFVDAYMEYYLQTNIEACTPA